MFKEYQGVSLKSVWSLWINHSLNPEGFMVFGHLGEKKQQQQQTMSDTGSFDGKHRRIYYMFIYVPSFLNSWGIDIDNLGWDPEGKKSQQRHTPMQMTDAWQLLKRIERYGNMLKYVKGISITLLFRVTRQHSTITWTEVLSNDMVCSVPCVRSSYIKALQPYASPELNSNSTNMVKLQSNNSKVLRWRIVNSVWAIGIQYLQFANFLEPAQDSLFQSMPYLF